MPTKHKSTLRDFALILRCIEHIFFTTRDLPETPKFAVLDTGGCIQVSKKVRVGDGICGSNGSLIFYRPTQPSGCMLHDLERDETTSRLSTSGRPGRRGPRTIRCGRYVARDSFGDINGKLYHEGMSALTMIKNPTFMLLALV